MKQTTDFTDKHGFPEETAANYYPGTQVPHTSPQRKQGGTLAGAF
jgi:hypothetical protein